MVVWNVALGDKITFEKLHLGWVCRVQSGAQLSPLLTWAVSPRLVESVGWWCDDTQPNYPARGTPLVLVTMPVTPLRILETLIHELCCQIFDLGGNLPRCEIVTTTHYAMTWKMVDIVGAELGEGDNGQFAGVQPLSPVPSPSPAPATWSPHSFVWTLIREVKNWPKGSWWHCIVVYCVRSLFCCFIGFGLLTFLKQNKTRMLMGDGCGLLAANQLIIEQVFVRWDYEDIWHEHEWTNWW